MWVVLTPYFSLASSNSSSSSAIVKVYACKLHISYWMGSHLTSLDIVRVYAVFGRVRRTSQIQARRAQCPVILDGYPFNEEFYIIPYTSPMILNGLVIKPSNIIGYWKVCHMESTDYKSWADYEYTIYPCTCIHNVYLLDQYALVVWV